jgi:hypothetical protein
MKKPNRYILFAYDICAPAGGVGDILGCFDNTRKAKACFRSVNVERDYEIAEIYYVFEARLVSSYLRSHEHPRKIIFYDDTADQTT